MKNEPNQQKWIEWVKRLPDWIKAAIGLITIIIGFVVTLRSNYHLGIVIVSALAIISLFLFFIYIASAKTPPLIEGGKGIYRYEKYRRLSIISILLTLVLLFVIISSKTSRSFIVTAVVGTATPQPQTLEISQVLMSESDTKYRLEVTLENSLEQDLLITGITLYSSEVKNISCTAIPPQTYEFSDNFNISKANGDGLVFQGYVANTNDKEFQYKVKGESFQKCGEKSLKLQFDTSFVLPAKSFLQLNLLFPNEMRLVNSADSERISFISDYFCTTSSAYRVTSQIHILTEKYGEFSANFPCKDK